MTDIGFFILATTIVAVVNLLLPEPTALGVPVDYRALLLIVYLVLTAVVWAVKFGYIIILQPRYLERKFADQFDAT